MTVKKGHVDVPLACDGDKGCDGVLSITYRTKAHRHMLTSDCTASGGAGYHLSADGHATISVPVHRSCGKALGRHHRLSAELDIKPQGGGSVTKSVSLVR